MAKKKEIKMSGFLLNRLLETFEGRAQTIGYKASQKMTLQHEFIIGAIACIDAMNENGQSCIPPSVWIDVIRGEMIQPIQP